MDRPSDDKGLLRATAVVARGGELDRKLDALAEQARSVVGATETVISVLDPLAMTLVPAAAAGADVAAQPMLRLDADDPAVNAVRERRPTTVAGTIALPLIFADERGAEDVEGVLVARLAGETATDTDGQLSAIANLCAIAIRQARLEHALVERADWLDRVASTDALTGLPNRTTFERVLEMEIARSGRQGSELSIVLFDIDGLARINEEAGAQVGDDLLRRTASLLAEQVRMVDTVARIGPDEFALIAPGSGGAIVARRVRDAAAETPPSTGTPLSLAAAIVVYPHDGATGGELLSAAQTTLERAKERGPGAIVATREP